MPPPSLHSSSSSSLSDEESCEKGKGGFQKPVFVSKDARIRLQKDKDLQYENELSQIRDLEERQKHRESQTRMIVREYLDKEKEDAEKIRLGIERGTKSSVELPVNYAVDGDDVMPSDDIPEELAKEEFEAWKQRELARIKRDWLRVNAVAIQLAEKDSRRRLTSEEKAIENEALRKERLEQSGVRKGKMQFMQKYYHKGAFFQNIVETGSEEAFKKDFNEAIGIEKLDLNLLPKCMQVRSGDFGKRSRSKYTHLKDQDTSDRSSGWNK